MHLNDRALRAYLDNEDTSAERAAAAAHLESCPDCRSALAAVSARVAEVAARMGALAPAPESMPAAPAVWARLQSRRRAKESEGNANMLATLFSKRLRPVWAGLLVLALLVAAFTVDPVRVWAGQFLGLFRAQQVAVVPIDTSRLSELGSSKSPFSQQMSQLLSGALTITREPGEPRVVPDAAAASQAAGFAVRLPASRTESPQFTVQDGAAFQFVVDRARAQAVLDAAGRSDLQLPASIDGTTIKVDIPAGVSVAYGNCPEVAGSDTGMMMGGSPGRRYANCVILAQIPSPTVDTPPNVDLQQLAEIALQFTGMEPDQAHSFASTVDWTSTLVVPIPRGGAVYQQITVDGVNGYLIQRPSDDAPEYALIWVKNGIVYAIGGLGSDTSVAVGMANSLK